MKLNWHLQEVILGLPDPAYQRQIGQNEVYLFRELLPQPRAHRPPQLQTNALSHQLSCSFNIDSCTCSFLSFDTPHTHTTSLLQLNPQPPTHSPPCSLHLSQFHTPLSPSPPPLSLSLPLSLSNTHTLHPSLRAGFIRRQVSEVRIHTRQENVMPLFSLHSPCLVSCRLWESGR